MNITAVVLSANEYTKTYEGIKVLVHKSIIVNSSQLLAARKAAIMKVTTPFFFFLDDDDDLPSNFQEVLQVCLEKIGDNGLAYTNEIINDLAAGTTTVRLGKEYSQREQLLNPLLIHHLVLCNTKLARESALTLPEGPYSPEIMIYWDLALKGAVHVPMIGYIWNKNKGMHSWPETTFSQVHAMIWCKKRDYIEV